LIRELEKLDTRNKYFILLREEDYLNLNFSNPRFKKVRAEAHWYGLKEQIVLPLVLKKIKPDLVHFLHFNIPFFYNKPFIVTIHDLTLLSFPTSRATTLNKLIYILKEGGYKMVISRALKKSKAVISVSKNTALDIRRHFPKINKDKIKVIYEGVGDSKKEDIEKYEKVPANLRRKRLKEVGIKFPYILHLGGAYPHKNLEKLIRSFKKTAEIYKKRRGKDIYLVLAGGDDYFFTRLKETAKKYHASKVIFPGFIKPGRDLEYLYQESLFCIFPSLCEGFGLPPLEALQRNKLVLASKNTCFPEILKKSAIFFNGKKEKDIAKTILNTLKNIKELEKEYIAKAPKTLKLYNWKKMAGGIIEIYEKTGKNIG